MIVNITYNKLDGTIVITDDENLMEAVVSKNVDTDDEVSFEISLNTSAYQTQFNEDTQIDGNNN